MRRTAACFLLVFFVASFVSSLTRKAVSHRNCGTSQAKSQANPATHTLYPPPPGALAMNAVFTHRHPESCVAPSGPMLLNPR